MRKLSIIMPAYNEEKTIEKIIHLVQKVDLSRIGFNKEIIIIDDCSKDQTADIVRRLQRQFENIRLLSHMKNSGKGAAVKTGIKHATGDILIIQDADMENDPNDYIACISPIVEGKAKVVYGSRRLNKDNKKKAKLSFFMGGVIVTWFFNILYLQHITDEPTCYKTFKTDVIKNIRIDGSRFEWEPEVTAKIAKMGIKIHEVPISYFPRSIKEGKKIRWKDGVVAIWTLIKYRFIK
jgi:glycosyltransferase involved in cell wall biosynthesis